MKRTERRCAACRKAGDARSMIRIAVHEGEAHVDSKRRFQSRGVNLCEDMSCYDKAAKKGLIAVRLKTGAFSEEKARELREEFQRELAMREESE